MSMAKSALDFRAFIEELRQHGDLVDVKCEVDAELEIAAIVRKIYEEKRPAALFHHIKGAMPGSRILGAPAGLAGKKRGELSRVALHLGLPRDSGPKSIIEAIRKGMKPKPIPPRQVASGPVKENVWIGDQVDLTRFPVPLLHENDGGRYFGTYGYHVVRTPDGSWTSWSVARAMLLDRNRLVGPAFPTQHIGKVRELWTREGKPMPWAMVLGGPPASLVAAGMPLPDRVSEPDYVGALLGEPVEVVKAETQDLWVPAQAEIVLEGEVSLTELADEGPMGEYHGYAFPTGHQQPVFHVKAVTFRNDPILPICVAGLPPEENHTIWATMISAQVLEVLQNAELPVDMVWCSYEAAVCWAVVSVDTAKLAALNTDAEHFSKRVAEVFFGSHSGHLVPKIILVSNDIDITDINEVVWALATRFHPKHDHFAYPDIADFPMVPYLNEDDHQRGSGGKAVINCLFPEQFQGKMRGAPASFRHSFPASLQQKVIERWKEYGFPED